jgi:hypothetical protein
MSRMPKLHRARNIPMWVVIGCALLMLAGASLL